MRKVNVNGMEEFGMIKKGPWKAEEDEVLLIHVNKYGPKDWSSIRSKGLLQRTGKSCRLRWVNKLRPNLKHGTKFSTEEERIVIELQGQFGNKWARIATYLPGRTDNDVKNFWSSRQKRLARLLHTQHPKSSNQSINRNRNEQVTQKVPELSSSVEDESSTSEPQQCSSSLIDNKSDLIQMLPLPDHALNSMPISHVQNLLQLEFDPDEKSLTLEPELQFHPFPPIPDILTDFPPKEGFNTIPNLFDVLGNGDVYGKDDDIAQFPFLSSCYGVEGHCRNGFKIENESPDIIFDELPLDMFDQIEHLQSPHHSGNI